MNAVSPQQITAWHRSNQLHDMTLTTWLSCRDSRLPTGISERLVNVQINTNSPRQQVTRQ